MLPTDKNGTRLRGLWGLWAETYVVYFQWHYVPLGYAYPDGFR